MNRAIISQRITSILAEIERLNNALYAMNTTDIQRYPDNYEVLSTDAALRAERITCRLRHLIYATTSIKKEEYLRSAETMQGIEISENDGILEIKLPCLLPKRRQRQSTEFLLDPFTSALSDYAAHHTTITAFLKTTPAKSPHGIPLAPRSLKVTAVSARKRSLRWSIKGGFAQEMETVTLRERSPLFRFLSLNGEKRSAALKSCQI